MPPPSSAPPKRVYPIPRLLATRPLFLEPPLALAARLEVLRSQASAGDTGGGGGPPAHTQCSGRDGEDCSSEGDCVSSADPGKADPGITARLIRRSSSVDRLLAIEQSRAQNSTTPGNSPSSGSNPRDRTSPVGGWGAEREGCGGGGMVAAVAMSRL
eukprot:scaffold8410_cov46-Isochrysis_galbana.AAC.1